MTNFKYVRTTFEGEPECNIDPYVDFLRQGSDFTAFYAYMPCEWLDHDGCGGQVPADLTTIYIKMPIRGHYMCDSGAVFSITIKELIDYLMDGHQLHGEGGAVLDIAARDTFLALSNELRALANRLSSATYATYAGGSKR